MLIKFNITFGVYCDIKLFFICLVLLFLEFLIILNYNISHKKNLKFTHHLIMWEINHSDCYRCFHHFK